MIELRFWHRGSARLEEIGAVTENTVYQALNLVIDLTRPVTAFMYWRIHIRNERAGGKGY